MIKKIVHQIWLQGDKNIPSELIKRRQTIINLHDSNWTYMLWDETVILLLLKGNNDALNVYYKFEYMHQRIDFAKYVILEAFGGVYIDMDVEMVGALDNLLNEYQDYDLIVSKIIISNFIEQKIGCDNDMCLNNGIIIAQKHSDVLQLLIKNIINKYECNLFDIKINCINNTTGPKFITHFLINYKGPSKLLFLEPEYLEPCVGDICYKNEKTVAMHKHTLTWFNNRFKKLFKMYINNSKRIYRLIQMIFLFFIIYASLNIYSRIQQRAR